MKLGKFLASIILLFTSINFSYGIEFCQNWDTGGTSLHINNLCVSYSTINTQNVENIGSHAYKYSYFGNTYVIFTNKNGKDITMSYDEWQKQVENGNLNKLDEETAKKLRDELNRLNALRYIVDVSANKFPGSVFEQYKNTIDEKVKNIKKALGCENSDNCTIGVWGESAYVGSNAGSFPDSEKDIINNFNSLLNQVEGVSGQDSENKIAEFINNNFSDLGNMAAEVNQNQIISGNSDLSSANTGIDSIFNGLVSNYLDNLEYEQNIQQQNSSYNSAQVNWIFQDGTQTTDEENGTVSNANIQEMINSNTEIQTTGTNDTNNYNFSDGGTTNAENNTPSLNRPIWNLPDF